MKNAQNMDKSLKHRNELRIHVGGRERREGWIIMDVMAQPETDIVGDIRDLSRFPDNSVAEIYASHVLEHISHREISGVLKEIWRVLIPAGKFYVAVPDLEVLCTLFLAPGNGMAEKARIMPMMFGAQADAHDFHFTGFDFDLLAMYLSVAGFSSAEQVESFGLFQDTSEAVAFGRRISLNLIVTK